MRPIIFIDTEVSEKDNKVYDLGAVKTDDSKLHTNLPAEFHDFISDSEFIGGHNIVEHDAKYLLDLSGKQLVDTLYLSPLLFPNKPYHALLKDDKLQTDELNNPLNDSIKAMELFYDELNAFEELCDDMKLIFYKLLNNDPHFSGFFSYIGYSADDDLERTIHIHFSDRICRNSPISELISLYPVELAYCLAFISATEQYSLLPRWIQVNYPKVDYLSQILRGTSCGECEYCKNNLDPKKYLSKYFGYSSFRKYNDEPLQENAVNAAVQQKSLLAIFPTGGGKSLTFQIPALIAGETKRALTVVISPLQSLMKDQVDNLEKRGIADAVTINGLLSPIERADAIDRVESGIASILYISPESLRSSSIERLFLSRNIDRFVIDEAHCFSAWGQDFRVDYLYIGDFIRELQEKKGTGCKIPVSCFTATAKQKVISDIKDYFKNKLGLDLEVFATDASRTNLRYEVLYKDTDAEKYETLRDLIERKQCPTIVYVSRTKRTFELAEKLTSDGFKALPFNGKMESSSKQENQEVFINDKVQIIVATSAFGMGVDKANVKLVIHYDISDSLENYVQEAGRAGRDQSLQAECYVLFNNNDLDKHFMLLNQTKLSIGEIQQVWKAVKELTKTRPEVCCSPLEVARQAGWDECISDVETRVKTALQSLENAGYLKRGKNVPRIYATSILVKNMLEASEKINNSVQFTSDTERTTAIRIIKSLISSKSTARARNDDAESRIDYLSDRLGIHKSDVIHSIQLMREEGILADTKDLTAYIQRNSTSNKSLLILHRAMALESFLLEYFDGGSVCINYKELNEAALAGGVKTSSVNSIKKLFYYWNIRGYISKNENAAVDKAYIRFNLELKNIAEIRRNSYKLAELIVEYLYYQSNIDTSSKEEILVGFSIMELMDVCKKALRITIKNSDIEEALLFLAKIGSMKLEGGFTVMYSGMKIQRLILDNKIRYKLEDYKQLNEFYKQKIQQIHIVGEYANMMVKDYQTALQFVNDYFQLDYKKFLATYFAGERAAQIEMNITPEKYKQLFATLSPLQLDIINDSNSRNIVVSAGPGSGKTRVLVHKLAALLLLEDVKHEQLLMLTFSRAAAIEFKQRLFELIGNAAHFVEIKTFHSYCFDLLGKIGNIDESDNVVKNAADLIISGDIDLSRITKSVLVIDEAQDMDNEEFRLVEALIERNDDMRTIAVGDDDQNIYEFRGSSSKYLSALISRYGARQYSLIENYRSSRAIVSFANNFVKSLSSRMKFEDIVPVTKDTGSVTLIKHRNANMEIALVDDMMSYEQSGSTCILTRTNHKALVVLGILKERGIPAKLIHSMDGFDLTNIMEIRYFKKKLDEEETSPVISESQWQNALDKMTSKYEKSECLETVTKILSTFYENNLRKYRTDFDLFLHESKLEDFYQSERGVVTVSTLHKAKGREFDNVYMLINSNDITDDASIRAVYVGITRAKKTLHIHYNGNLMDDHITENVEIKIDNNSYPKPKELIRQLSHKDVYLDYFKDKKHIILNLRSGMHLKIKDNKLYINSKNGIIPVLQFSKSFYNEIRELLTRGYVPYDAKIRYICSWMNEDKKSETAVILPDIYFYAE